VYPPFAFGFTLEGSGEREPYVLKASNIAKGVYVMSPTWTSPDLVQGGLHFAALIVRIINIILELVLGVIRMEKLIKGVSGRILRPFLKRPDQLSKKYLSRK
jgi:hypothetical protein